jgi:membrane associated rhomboid family serine protease
MNPIKQELSELRQNIVLPLQIVAIMWLVKIIETLFHISFSNLGVLPRDVSSIWHIFTMPFIHGSWEHLISNSLPFIALGFLVLQTYKQVSLRIFTIVYALSGLGIWLMARGQSHHIGASGVIYGLAFFLFFSGIFRRDVKSMATALIVALFYGGMVWGLLPIQEGVSWEGHLFGALSWRMVRLSLQKHQPTQTFPMARRTPRRRQNHRRAFLGTQTTRQTTTNNTHRHHRTYRPNTLQKKIPTASWTGT